MDQAGSQTGFKDPTKTELYQGRTHQACGHWTQQPLTAAIHHDVTPTENSRLRETTAHSSDETDKNDKGIGLAKRPEETNHRQMPTPIQEFQKN